MLNHAVKHETDLLKYMERCPSGLRSTLGKRVCVYAYRGFESLPLRNNISNQERWRSWLNVAVSKTVVPFGYRGFESPPLRSLCIFISTHKDFYICPSIRYI